MGNHKGTQHKTRRDTWVIPYFLHYKKTLAASVALGILTFAFAAMLMFSSGFLISDAAEEPYLGLYAIMFPLGFVQVFGVGKPLIAYIERLVSHGWVLKCVSAMRYRLYSVVEKNALFWSNTRRMGDILGLFAEDIGHIQDFYLRSVFPFVVAWGLGVLAACLFGLFSVPFALAMLVEFAILTLLMPLVSVLVNGARSMREKELVGRMYTDLSDNVVGVADWKFAGREDDYLARFFGMQAEVDELAARTKRSRRAIELAVHLLFGAGALATLVWCAARFGVDVDPSAAQAGLIGRSEDWIAAFVLGYFPLIEAFAPLQESGLRGVTCKGAMNRLNDLDDCGPLDPDASADGETADQKPTPDGCQIVLDDVVFSYAPQDRPVLDGVSLTVQAGQKIALLGPSGTGKSTLLSLVRGDLVPSSGSVTVGGVAAGELGDEAARHIGVIGQQTYLFNATLLENLRVGRAKAGRKRCEAVLRSVGLGNLLDRLPQGLDTVVDEAGLCFSGGERHRIALARVLLQDVPIVLLDEPTVGLDPATERALLDELFSALADKTVLMVTHHLMCAPYMDRVIFLENGHIAMDGTPRELEASSDRYRNLLAFDRGISLRR